MQCTSYSPGYYSRDLNGVSNSGNWPMYANDISPNMRGQSCNNFYPPPNAEQIRAVYHNEVLKQTMLRHDNVFREQVQELHRLHKRQRELMDEYKRTGLKNPKIVPISRYNSVSLKVSSDCTSMTWQTPTAPTLPWLSPAANNLPSPVSKSPSLTFSFLNTFSENKNILENNQVLPPMSKKPKLNMNMMAFDLNIPPNLSPELEIFQTNTEIKIEEKTEYNINLNKEYIEYSHEGVFETKGKLNRFDLNISFDEEETLSIMPIAKTVEKVVSKIDLEAPVSPENKESSPPRQDSGENSEPSDDLVSTAAETILLISKSIFNEETKASLVESLDWFAGVVVSSMENDGSEKEDSECVVALPSQHGKRHRKRRVNKKVFQIEVFRSLYAWSYDLGFGEKDLNSWGKVNKRRRGSRVPASSIRLAWR